jgi:hypothetical protein
MMHRSLQIKAFLFFAKAISPSASETAFSARILTGEKTTPKKSFLPGLA